MIRWCRSWVTAGTWSLMFFLGMAQAAELVDLAKKGDVAALTAALNEGTPVDQLEAGVTALYVASESGNVDLVRLLIERGADVDLTVRLQRTPLYGAVKAGYSPVVRLLLDAGADPNKRAKQQTPLHVAADSGCLQCVIDLVEAGAEVNALLDTGVPPIHYAVRNGHEDIAAYLREHGAGPEPSRPISPLLASADIGAGKQTFDRICVQCHLATPDAGDSKTDRVNLWGILGRPKGSQANALYSSALMSAGGTWTYEELNGFISHPALTLPGTEMGFAGLPDEEDRADLIAYLRTLSDAPVELP